MYAFKEPGVDISGKNAFVQTHGIWKNEVVPFATGFGSLLKSPLFLWSEKLQFTQLIIQLWKMNIDKVMTGSLSDWAEKEIQSPMIRHHFYDLDLFLHIQERLQLHCRLSLIYREGDRKFTSWAVMSFNEFFRIFISSGDMVRPSS